MPKASKQAATPAKAAKKAAPAKKATPSQAQPVKKSARAKATPAAKKAVAPAKKTAPTKPQTVKKAAPQKAAPAAKKAPAKKAASATPQPSKKVAVTKPAPAKKATPAVKKAAPAPAKKAAPAAKKAAPAPVKKAAPAAKAAPAKAQPAKKTAEKAPAPAPEKKVAPAPKKAAPVVEAKPKVNPYLKQQKFLDEMRAKLEADKVEEQRLIDILLGQAETLRESRESGDDTSDEFAGGEGSTIAVDRSDMLYQVQLLRDAIDEINEALWRLDRGTWGMCSSCGDPIIKDRLKAVPASPMCAPCKRGGILRSGLFQR